MTGLFRFRRSFSIGPLILFCSALLLSGCSRQPPTIDGSSDATAKTSIERVKQSLPVDRREDFELSVKAVVMKVATRSEMDTFILGGPLSTSMLAALHGKTAEQVISEAALTPRK